jgi:hypothetical protein
MSVKITVAAAGIDIQAPPLQKVASEEKQDYIWGEAERKSGFRCDQGISATGVGDIFA